MIKVAKVRKNFLFDKDMVEKVQEILSKKHKNLTEAIALYFQALVKEPEILDAIEKSAHKRSGNFIGMLDGKIGDEDRKSMHKTYAKSSEKFQ
ncbi:MAG: hypothetical protein DRG24_04960 [Epsilonproteobacteria bacterium]|nr:MAG: hypothetical protein DRG24_04960 [Campylobacterota bacterium]